MGSYYKHFTKDTSLRLGRLLQKTVPLLQVTWLESVKGLQVTSFDGSRETILSELHLTVPPLQVTLLSVLHLTPPEGYVHVTGAITEEH